MIERSSSIPQKIARNTLFNSIGRFWSMGVSFLLTPYIISQIGIERFGIWSLISVLVGYFGLLDLGVNYAFVKYIAEEEVKTNYQSINRIVNTGLVFYLALAVLIVPSAYLMSDQLLSLLKAPPEIHDEVLFILTAAVLIFCLSNAFSVFEGVITGLQRMDISNAIKIVSSVPQAISTVLLLRLGYGLRGLITAQAIMFGVASLLLLTAAFRLLPTLRLSPRYFHWPSLRRLVSYGAKVQVSRLAELAGPQTNKLILGHFVGLSAVTFYELGARVVRMTKSFVLLGAIVPAASELDARESWPALQQLYQQGSKFLALMVAPLMLFSIPAAPLMIRAWMGTDFPQAVLAIRILAVGHFVHILTGVGTTIVRGIGKPGYETRYALLLSIVNPLLSLLLVLQFGFEGVLVGTTIALVLSSLYFFALFHRLMKLQLLRMIQNSYLVPMVGCVVASIAGYGIVESLHALPWLDLGSRLSALVLLTVEGTVFLGTYSLWIWRIGYLNLTDRQLLYHLIGSLLTEAGIERAHQIEPSAAHDL